MLFLFRNKTVKELRKKQGLTTKELAQMIKVENIEILKVDNLKIKEVPEPLRSKMLPVLKGEHYDKIPW